MIGAILSMKYFGKKSWGQSLIFWIVYLIAGAVVSSALYTISATVGGILIGALLFIALAHYWYKFNWMMSLKLFAIAFVIDLIIMVVLVAVLFALIGFTLPNLIPSVQFLQGAI